MKPSLLRKPAAFLPLAMSLAALTLVVAHFALFGVVSEADEGTPAHVFQLLMIAQVPIVGYFALTQLPDAPIPALKVLVLHLAFGAAAILSVLALT